MQGISDQTRAMISASVETDERDVLAVERGWMTDREFNLRRKRRIAEVRSLRHGETLAGDAA